MDFDAVKKLASLPTRVVSLCLAGEIVEELAELERRLEATPPPSNLGDGTRQELAEQIVAAQERMRESTVDFHLRAMPSRAYTTFILARPERAEKEENEVWQARIFPWFAELVSRTVFDPAMSVDQVTELVDLIHFDAWNDLAGACLGLNNGKLDVPNSEAASVLTGTSAQT